MTSSDLEDRLQIFAACRPARGIGRRVDEQRFRLRRDRLFQPLQIERPATIGEGERYADGLRSCKIDCRDDVRPAGRQIDHLVAGGGQRLDSKRDRLHARCRDIEMLDRQIDGEMALIVAGKRLAKLGNAALPGVEGLAAEQSFACGAIDEVGCRQITFARPERQQTVTTTRIVDNLDDTAFRGGECAGAEAIQQGHGVFTPSISAACLADRRAKIP